MFATMGSSGISANTLDEVVRVLAVLNSPEQARAALNELKGALADLTARQQVAATAEAENTKQLAQLVQTQQAQNQRSADLDAREATLGRRQTETDVAAAALQEREASVKARELAADDRETMLAAREQALEARIANYRAALSA